MKSIEDITCCVMDYGTFLGLSDMMGRVCKRTLYYSPFETEYQVIEKCLIGDGFEHFERCDEPLDPSVFGDIDLFIFPDIAMAGLERHLRDYCGKMVWGSFGATELELFRTKFMKVIKRLGLPYVPTVTIRGLTNLAAYLKENPEKWVKINRYRGNMETWFHKDWEHSQREMERLALVFGPLADAVTFVVQDPIEGEEDSPVLELGYDGWSIDGEFAPASFQGYEAKNELYLGSLLQYAEIPEQVREVNEAMAPELAKVHYRNFWATELRIKEGIGYFIDPTPRMAGQTMEHLFTCCENLPEVILAGAQGEVIEPIFTATHAAEATIHQKTQNESEGWRTFKVPDDCIGMIQLYRCCHHQGLWQYPPNKSNELGVVCGWGDSIEDAMYDLKANFENIKDEPVHIELSGFADLVKQIEDAKEEGVHFTDKPIPEPAAVVQPE
jgi:hypothetical protein